MDIAQIKLEEIHKMLSFYVASQQASSFLTQKEHILDALQSSQTIFSTLNSLITPAQKSLKVGDHTLQINNGTFIFGQIINTPSDLSLPSEYIFIHAHSAAAPEGTPLRTHRATIASKISKETFELARKSDWAVLPDVCEKLKENFDVWLQMT